MRRKSCQDYGIEFGFHLSNLAGLVRTGLVEREIGELLQLDPEYFISIVLDLSSTKIRAKRLNNRFRVQETLEKPEAMQMQRAGRSELGGIQTT